MLEKLINSIPETTIKTMLAKSVGGLLEKSGAQMLVIEMENGEVKFTPVLDGRLITETEYNQLKDAARKYYETLKNLSK